MAPIVSIAIVLHNSERRLANCLEALSPDLEDGFVELIAVDNASPDRSAEIVERRADGACVIKSPANVGFAAGVNKTWPHSTGRYWLLLNPDVRLAPGALRRLVGWLDDRPTAAVVSAELTDAKHGRPATGRALPSLWRALLELSRLHLVLPAPMRGRVLRGAYWVGGDQEDAGWVPAAALLARREAVESVGLLDERFFLYGEDIEWCWRMRRAGWSVGVCSSALATHHESSSAELTFGDEETRARMVKGEIEAVRVSKGYGYARLYAWLTTVALRVEAAHPRRSAEYRSNARRSAGTWSTALRGLTR